MKKGKLGIPNLEVFGQTMVALAAQNKGLLAVTSDSRGSGKLVPFGEKYPEQIVETGIAEQNLVGVAAGLASCGKKVFAVSPSCFLSARSLEQIKNDVCYSNWPVKLIGISAGVSYGNLGSTHHSTHDLAVLRAIHNITIVVPADNFETEQAIRQAVDYPHPIFIRMGKKPMYHLHEKDTIFEFGKAIRVREGRDLAFVATGETVQRAWFAAEQLAKEQGIQARVISMHTVKPLDEEVVLKAARECGALITVEEHRLAGGLGEACATVLMEAGLSLPFRRIGIPDEYTVTGSQFEILDHYGISAEGLAKAGLALLKKAEIPTN